MPASLDELFNITCGPCSRTSPVADWCRTASGPLPHGEYQCPGCGRSFKRHSKPNCQPWEKYIQLGPVQSQL